MARPKRIDDEALLESARATFLELGASVSTLELARRAGVSEGTLFKRFGSKMRLFQKAMRLPNLDEEPWAVDMLARAGEGDLEAHLRELALGLGRHIDGVLPAMQTVHRHGGLTCGQIRELCGKDEPSGMKTLRRFRELFAREIELGRLRPMDPATLADMFVGAVLHQCHMRLYFYDENLEDAERYAARLARDFVELAAFPR